MALVTKAQINAAVDRKWEDVPVPEWGGDVRLMALSAADRGYIEAGSVVANGQTPQLKVESLKVYREKLVGMAMVDENLERMRTFLSDGDDAESRVNRLWDGSIEPPFRIGMACGACHIAYDPLNPPENVNNPAWENIDALVRATDGFAS